MSLGEKIRRIRKSNNMSQEEMACRLGVTRQKISNIENDLVDVSVSFVKNFALMFDLEIGSLIFDGDENSGLGCEEKIKFIIEGCNFLLDRDLDFVVRIISLLNLEYVKRGR